ncbi:ORF6N domain-containing protein [Salmonella enterica subsp. diarizonae serovar 16:z10:e,n,x,z15]|uniref:ORF6N domain-containing protein n=1 Tax=Salmonella enterica TaxID=28901 RepID=UPI00126E5A3F|nr:ORF6N domain-containing protein [Salmonella enterica subsp. diarizonae]EDZ4084043.1 ORF6N domain-containing protein [Salmonella enterica]EEM3071003.1 hypothetical protein [Salmonella enterica subsp. enterica serovar Java]MCH5495870.1 ORF6N domain-containing protein [Salmonella enterica subsp. diarizonae serovar 16:z10:e,n,x,z15]EDU5552010.1 ORF6N domain-containing protein [Salmonella enterica subsp. diarizonae]
MSNPISVKSLKVVTYYNEPVLTTELVAMLMGEEPTYIRQIFGRYRAHFIEGEHYFYVTGEERRKIKKTMIRGNMTSTTHGGKLILLNERGITKLLRLFNTDEADMLLEDLENNYFNVPVKNNTTTKSRPNLSTSKQTTPLRQLVERLITTDLGKAYPGIWKLVHQRFGVDQIQQLSPEQITEAIEYLKDLEIEHRKIASEARNQKTNTGKNHLPYFGELKRGDRLLIEVDSSGNISQKKLDDEVIVGTIDTFLWLQDRAGFMAIRKDAIPAKHGVAAKISARS